MYRTLMAIALLSIGSACNTAPEASIDIFEPDFEILPSQLEDKGYHFYSNETGSMNFFLKDHGDTSLYYFISFNNRISLKQVDFPFNRLESDLEEFLNSKGLIRIDSASQYNDRSYWKREHIDRIVYELSEQESSLQFLIHPPMD